MYPTPAASTARGGPPSPVRVESLRTLTPHRGAVSLRSWHCHSHMYPTAAASTARGRGPSPVRVASLRTLTTKRSWLTEVLALSPSQRAPPQLLSVCQPRPPLRLPRHRQHHGPPPPTHVLMAMTTCQQQQRGDGRGGGGGGGGGGGSL